MAVNFAVRTVEVVIQLGQAGAIRRSISVADFQLEEKAEAPPDIHALEIMKRSWV